MLAKYDSAPRFIGSDPLNEWDFVASCFSSAGAIGAVILGVLLGWPFGAISAFTLLFLIAAFWSFLIKKTIRARRPNFYLALNADTTCPEIGFEVLFPFCHSSAAGCGEKGLISFIAWNYSWNGQLWVKQEEEENWQSTCPNEVPLTTTTPKVKINEAWQAFCDEVKHENECRLRSINLARELTEGLY